MNHRQKITLVSSLLLGLTVGGYLLGTRHAIRPAGVTLAGPGPRWVGPPAVKPASRRAQAPPRLASVSPLLPQVLPGLNSAVDDWRGFTPDFMVVQMAPDLALPFRVTKVQQGNGRTVLTARLAKSSEEPSDLDGSFLVSTANTPDRWEAVVVLPGDEYHIHINRDAVTVEEVHPETQACGTDHLSAPPAALPAPVKVLPTALGRIATGGPADPAATDGMPATPLATAAGDQPGLTVDVLFLYNADALAAKNGDRLAIDADCSNFIAAANTILANSQITNFTWRYVACIPAPAYPTTTNLCDDLAQMGSGTLAAFTADQQNAYGADQVVLLIGGARNDYAGYAWIGGGLHHAVVSYPACLSASGHSNPTSALTVCHEMAHNFGCHHDREVEGVPTDSSHYYYGQRFNDAANYNADTGTVMSYSTGARLAYFSNPNLYYHGYALGVVPGQDSSADNAKIMTDQAQGMAATNTAPVTFPVITQQPQPVTVGAGQPFDLSVAATGGNLAYQWYKDGAAINGAGGSSYGVASAASSDACSYRVTVSNSLGTATSAAVTVTVAPSPSSSTMASTPGPVASAAAGGGAFDEISGAVLLVLLVLRGRITFQHPPRRGMGPLGFEPRTKGL